MLIQLFKHLKKVSSVKNKDLPPYFHFLKFQAVFNGAVFFHAGPHELGIVLDQ
jgi:hypothetical protein